MNEVLNAQLSSQVDKLLQELKEIKQILRVPRLHFKYLEKLEFEELVGVKNQVASGGLLSPHSNANKEGARQKEGTFS